MFLYLKQTVTIGFTEVGANVPPAVEEVCKRETSAAPKPAISKWFLKIYAILSFDHPPIAPAPPILAKPNGSSVSGPSAPPATARRGFNSASSTASRSSADLFHRSSMMQCAARPSDPLHHRCKSATKRPSARNTTSKNGDRAIVCAEKANATAKPLASGRWMALLKP